MKLSLVIAMMPSPESASLPSFANTLFQETPTDTASPSSSFTRSEISRAMSKGLPPNSESDPVTSIQDSSSPNGSTWFVYS